MDYNSKRAAIKVAARTLLKNNAGLRAADDASENEIVEKLENMADVADVTETGEIKFFGLENLADTVARLKDNVASSHLFAGGVGASAPSDSLPTLDQQRAKLGGYTQAEFDKLLPERRWAISEEGKTPPTFTARGNAPTASVAECGGAEAVAKMTPEQKLAVANDVVAAKRGAER